MSFQQSSKLLRGVSLCRKNPFLNQVASMSSEVGSGSGKGGGSGGRLVEEGVKKAKSTVNKIIDSAKRAQQCGAEAISVREAGGSLGKKGAAQEEMYFDKQNKAMKSKLKEHLKDEIKKHEEAIKASKELMKDLEK